MPLALEYPFSFYYCSWCLMHCKMLQLKGSVFKTWITSHIQNLLLLDNILNSLSSRCKGLSIFFLKSHQRLITNILSQPFSRGLNLRYIFCSSKHQKTRGWSFFTLCRLFFIYPGAAASLPILIKKFPISYIIHRMAGLHFPTDGIFKKSLYFLRNSFWYWLRYLSFF